MYDCQENIENDELNPDNWPNVLARKNYTIDQQEIKIKSLEKKIETWEEISSHQYLDALSPYPPVSSF